jgi:PLD-like domain
MAGTRFLDREQYWWEISTRVPSAKRVRAAVAYLGKGGSEYLPLRAGDQLVVDLSLGTVKQGATDPREIKKLIKRGVDVFTRRDLHAKVVVIDDIVIASSANVSENARNYLDEAAILSSSPAVVRAAKHFIRLLCSEPVHEQYLKECITQYKPPVFKAARTIRQPKQRKQRAKLWFINGLVYLDDKTDRPQIEILEKEAKRELLDPEYCEVDWIRFRNRPKWFFNVQKHNWIIDCTRSSKRTRDVGSPARVTGKRRYTTKAGTTYHMLMLDRPVGRENMSFTEFNERWRKLLQNGRQPLKRSGPITDHTLADALMRFWTNRGRISKRGHG